MSSDGLQGLQAYVSRLCPLVLDFAGNADHAREFEDLLVPGAPGSDALAQFASETTAALFIEYTPYLGDDEGGEDPAQVDAGGGSAPDQSHFVIGFEPTAVLGSGSASVAIVKSIAAALREDVSIASQLRVS